MGRKRRGLLVIIPAFNEEAVIGETVRGVRRELADCQVLVVDDGSGDRTREVARRVGAQVVRHPVNRGLGGALGTGLYWAKERAVAVAVTFDADGQHDPRDIARVVEPIERGEMDVVIGTRTAAGRREIPADRRALIGLSNLLTWWLFGIRASDTTSGFRAFNRRAIEVIRLRTDRMEVANEFFSEIRRHGLRYGEVPIRVIYTDYSRSKGQKNSNALDVAFRLLLRLFR